MIGVTPDALSVLRSSDVSEMNPAWIKNTTKIPKITFFTRPSVSEIVFINDQHLCRWNSICRKRLAPIDHFH